MSSWSIGLGSDRVGHSFAILKPLQRVTCRVETVSW